MVDKFEALEPLRENWDRIYESDPEAHFFLSWPWMSNWLRRPGWMILAARSPESNEYVAFFPLQLVTGLDEQTGFYSSIRMAGSYFATYTGFICVPEFEEQVISSFADRLQALNWRALHFDDISISAKRRQMLLGRFSDSDFVKEKIERRRHTTRTGETINHDIYMYVDLPADWDEFLDGNLNPKTRRDVRHFLRQVENSGEYRITIADFETIQSDLEVLFQLWLTQWEAKSRVYAQGIIANCRYMLLECHKAGVLFAPVLWKGDTPLGVHIAFIDKSKLSLVCFLVSRNLAIRKPPPGLVLHAQHPLGNSKQPQDLRPWHWRLFVQVQFRIEGAACRGCPDRLHQQPDPRKQAGSKKPSLSDFVGAKAASGGEVPSGGARLQAGARD
ncbi:GNAT family N-acetyltransferase [Mesorhizobium mediterraneum]|uniref:GNAT family N-acetyltransferase n=1 Tax=Mesorhizobium mediterraneum TaxID=43617 RepID=UPI001782C17B|nr:GNAT family N-acetyltransferase [Mesorhizobium mediterraneum]